MLLKENKENVHTAFILRAFAHVLGGDGGVGLKSEYRPFGTGTFGRLFPMLKHWAIVGGPSGTEEEV
jgi:hypothetical protein